MTPFAWIDADSAAHAAALLREHGSRAQPIAAGGDLLGLWKEGVEGPSLKLPSLLINLAGAADLAHIAREGDMLRIGAMVTLARWANDPSLPPMLADAIAHIASPQLRARTTIGGNLLQRPRCVYFRHPDIVCFKKGGSSCAALGGPDRVHPGALFPGVCHAGHPSDLAPVLIALDAQAEVVGPDGARSLPLQALYEGAGANPRAEVVLAHDEVLAALHLRLGPRTQAFEKIAPRDANEFSWAGAAVALDLDGEAIDRARIVLSGIAPGPHEIAQASVRLRGRRVGDIDARDLAHELFDVDGGASPMLRARAHCARLAIERAWRRALARASRPDEP